MLISRHPIYFSRPMTYKETTEYLFNQMPMFERQGASGYKEGLYNTLMLDAHFNHPHRHYKTIHVAGTNGKGSCSHTMAAFFQACGYKVGLYTSPHLKDFRERIRINGMPISEEYVVKFVEDERNFFEPLHPSFFEVTTAMAFKYFRDEQVDIAIIEVGLGGRLDCTNIITPELSIITNISFDHTQFLGNTLAQIAREKAGIIKDGVPVVVGEYNAETRPVFEEVAKSHSSAIIFAADEQEVVAAQPLNNGGMMYKTKHFGELVGDLSGLYQIKNASTVLTAIRVLSESGQYPQLDANTNPNMIVAHAREAFKQVAASTGLMGRWQTISTNPLVICDTGHNVGGWKYLSEQLKRVDCRSKRIVFGMVNDKDIDGVLELLPKDAVYYFTKANTKRALSEIELQKMAIRHGLVGNTYPTVKQAYEEAKQSASQADLIFVGGSSYVVADFLCAFV